MPSRAKPVLRPVYSEEMGEAFQRLRLMAPNRVKYALHNPTAAGATAAELGLDIKQNMIWRLEAGKVKQPPTTSLQVIADLYGYTLQEVRDVIQPLMDRVVLETIKSRSDLIRPPVGLESSSKTPPDGERHYGTTGAGSSISPSEQQRLTQLEAGLREIVATAASLLGEITIALGNHRARAARDDRHDGDSRTAGATSRPRIGRKAAGGAR